MSISNRSDPWLKVQLGLGVVGGGVWFVGAFLEQDFIAGAGCGILVAALAIGWLLRRGADRQG